MPRLTYGKIIRSVIKRVVATGEIFDYTSSVRQGAQSGLLGFLHQIENAGMAIALLDTFCQEDRRSWQVMTVCSSFERDQMARAFGGLSSDPLMILDGAPIPMLSKALLATLQERFADYLEEILFTCIKTKALEDMLDLLETGAR